MSVSGLKIAYYGDDFTGATDTLATAARAGLRSLLFLGLPTDAQLERAGPLDCLGIAGAARAMSPDEMRAELEPVGRLFARLGAPVMHYKTCSTFDSAPQVGSIGAAIRILQPHAGNAFVPIVGGQPNLRRYCVFGNLFAGAGPAVHRLDRHPTMSRHPVTPMHEADLRRHLAAQGLAQVAGIAYPDYEQDDAALDTQLDALMAAKPDAVLLDVAHAGHLATVGRLVWQRAQQQTLLAAGPSSVVQALAAHWQAGDEPAAPHVAAATSPVLVLAGSLSPVTARQVQAASAYRQVALAPARLTGDADYAQHMAAQIATLLAEGRHVLACTSADGASAAITDGRALAHACGDLLARVLKAVPLRRLGIAGGDTSSHAVQALDAWGLSYAAQLAPGVALCRLHSDDAALDGMEIMLKGGQMGGEDLFDTLLHGTN
ncbi:four-carbon acid sugar kinase family protein [Polaromonas sp. YR568]|uniref:four-carbon acid sugar kinase family protein n=1 Tax=Polaromonas sp. YR568 TaxID=1855301 RepID=UPI00398C04C3